VRSDDVSVYLVSDDVYSGSCVVPVTKIGMSLLQRHFATHIFCCCSKSEYGNNIYDIGMLRMVRGDPVILLFIMMSLKTV
jgi:hypothetical protein